MGPFCASEYIRTSISTAVITRITWCFHGCSFKLLGYLSGHHERVARFISQFAGLHPARLRSKHYYTDKNGRKFRKEQGECETAAAGLAGLGSARKEDFQTQFIFNKILNNLCYNSQQL